MDSVLNRFIGVDRDEAVRLVRETERPALALDAGHHVRPGVRNADLGKRCDAVRDLRRLNVVSPDEPRRRAHGPGRHLTSRATLDATIKLTHVSTANTQSTDDTDYFYKTVTYRLCAFVTDRPPVIIFI